jgi:uncharacterized repeat protein (TIGR04138 family)
VGGEKLSQRTSDRTAIRHRPGKALKMQELSFEETIDAIRAKDARFHLDAYIFVREALDHTQRTVRKDKSKRTPHVTGQQLLEGIRDYALSQFGPMTQMVLEEWGVRSCQDFGDIVFNMVDVGLLAKTEEDSRADFQGGYDFSQAFRDPFLPPSQLRSTRPSTPKTTKV